MNAMILAAGRGDRMKPLTDHIPKPLLPVGGRPLIEHLIVGLASSGFTDIVVNHAHLGHMIEHALGDGTRFGVRIRYSSEPTGGLETAGGIVHALKLLEPEFVVVNGDIWTDFPFSRLRGALRGSAHLVLVDNPPHHVKGDFGLNETRVNATSGDFTFSGIGVYSRTLFASCAPGRRPLAPILREAMARGEVTGEHFQGRWFDIGTPQRLQELNRLLGTETRDDAG
ncbi:MAG: N-acetylmuramate alpha-1-phosphate uridylyltransferase MurU [Acidiferrobacteraceae bacterium]